MLEITQNDIEELLEYFSRNTYKAKEADAKSQDIMQKCLDLVSLDYSRLTISNGYGELSAHYPSQLIVMEYEISPSVNCASGKTSEVPCTIYENMYDVGKLRELFLKARFARCRSRFPLPVILYRGKHICRSATLSGGPEIYGRSGFDYFFSGSENIGERGEKGDSMCHSSRDWQLFDKVRSQDIKLLKTLNVGTIVDFMVEKKKVKFGMNVTSSEKVDKENRYSEFTIISLPYPGCEFFKEYRDNNYVAKDLVFDWSQAHVDATIGVPEDTVSTQLKIEWKNYKLWDLVSLTQNYMKLLLRYLQENSTGLLIHCISGWDRTPLFISLLRLSLWADGVIHQSLNEYQILYFTIAYDWMLFGHNLEDRNNKGEDIFFFCFDFLKHLIEDEYSVTARPKSKHVLRNDSDVHLDGLLFDGDCPVSSQGSNISLNSSSSSHSSRSQDLPPSVFYNVPDSLEESTNGNVSVQGMNIRHWQTCSTDSAMSPSCPRSPHPNRTSPVAVPVSSRLRQRNDSTSSLSIGSWQLISGTGSLRGSTSASASVTICDSQSTSNSQTSSYPSLREQRLRKVRSIFYTTYGTRIGFKCKGVQDTGFGSFLGNFAEKVGFISAQRTLCKTTSEHA